MQTTCINTMGKKNKKGSNRRGVPLSVEYRVGRHASAEGEVRWVISSFFNHRRSGFVSGDGSSEETWRPTIDELMTHMGEECIRAAIPDAVDILVERGQLMRLEDGRLECRLTRQELTALVYEHHPDFKERMTRLLSRAVPLLL